MSDQYIYEDISNSNEEFEPFVRKQLIYCQDNVSSYSGTFQIETSSLASSGLYANLRDAWLEIPYVVRFKSSSTTAAKGSIVGTANPYMFAIKNGFHQLINSITVELNSTNMVQQTNFTNLYVSYKLMTSFADEDVKKVGPTIGFVPDNSDSFEYSGDGTVLSGVGNCNNKIYVTASTGDGYFDLPGLKANTNAGLKKRLENVLDYSTQGITLAANSGGLNSTAATGRVSLSLDNALKSGFHVFRDDGAANDARVYSLHVLAHVRLKDICDFFDKIPLIKAPFLKITVSYNGVQSMAITKANGGALSVAGTSIIGQCCPVMFSSSSTDNPNNLVFTTEGDGATAVAAAKTITFSCNVGSSGGVSHSVFQNVRLYCPMYQMQPTIERNLLQTTPTKRVQYKDIYSFTVSGVTAGSSFNSLVTSSIINPKTVVVIPITNSASNGNLALSGLQSPFSSEGATTAPFAFLSSFQVQVSGSNIFRKTGFKTSLQVREIF